MEARPEALFRDFVTARNLKFVQSLKEFHNGLEATITNVTTSQNETLNARSSMWKALNEIKDIGIVGIQ